MLSSACNDHDPIEAQKLILRICSWEQLQAMYPIPDDVGWVEATDTVDGRYKNACNARSGESPAISGVTWNMYCTLHPDHTGLHIAHDGISGPTRKQICGAWTTDNSIHKSIHDRIK